MGERFTPKKIQSWMVSRLMPHPRQGVFRTHTAREIQDLAESLERDGLICPVEILPDGTVICGHGRLAAAKLLDWTTIAVWVRHDLEQQGEGAVFRRLVQDNLVRRQLTKLGMGRAYLALKEEEYEAWRMAGQTQAQGDFRDHLGELLGCDGTTAERWARLAVLPLDYDHLIETGLLTQQQAEKIANHLPADIQERLGHKLVAIASSDLHRKAKKEQVRRAVDARLGIQPSASKQPSQQRTQRFTSALEKAVRELPKSITEFAGLLESRDGAQVLLNVVRRKFPQEIGTLGPLDLILDQAEKAQLGRSVLLLLGALQAAEISGST